MFTRFTPILITLILAITMAGCGKATPSSSSTGSNNSKSNSTGSYTGTNPTDNYQMLPVISGKVANVQLDANADGTTQQLKKGEAMSITLESNPSTGFGWFATISNQDVLMQMGEPQYQEPPSSSATPILGAAGTDTFFFQAVGTGSATLTLEYKQGWETTVAPEKTITITVEVK